MATAPSTARRRFPTESSKTRPARRKGPKMLEYSAILPVCHRCRGARWEAWPQGQRALLVPTPGRATRTVSRKVASLIKMAANGGA